MRLDHIAYRVRDRHKAAEFFCKCLGYKIAKEFEPTFSDGTTQGVKCLVLEPSNNGYFGRKYSVDFDITGPPAHYEETIDFYSPHEIFISDGPKTSIVGKWVDDNGPGIHHLAYEVDNVESTMREWQANGYAEFSSDVIKCPGLEQVFTKPSEIIGVVIELIRRDKHGFCEDSVGKLMESTDELGR